jgi:hypothetical protein
LEAIGYVRKGVVVEVAVFSVGVVALVEVDVVEVVVVCVVAGVADSSRIL